MDGDKKLNTEDCPRCDCWSCINCGRWAAPELARDQHLELLPTVKIGNQTFPGDVRCELGQVEHQHEKAAA